MPRAAAKGVADAAPFYIEQEAPEPPGGWPKPGRLWANPALGETYRRVVREADAAGPDRVAQIDAARRAWYEGFVAEAIDRFVRGTEVLDASGYFTGKLKGKKFEEARDLLLDTRFIGN